MAEITEEQYQQALALVTQTEDAKAIIAKYEEQQRFETDPVAEIMENGEVEFVEGEIIRNNPLLWRATKLHYQHDKGTVEGIINYKNPSDSKDLLAIQSIQKIIL